MLNKRFLILSVLMFILAAMLSASAPARSLPALSCRSPWFVLSPGMKTEMEAKVNLDAEGNWIIHAPRLLIIWKASGGIANINNQGWEVSVSLGTSQAPDICGFINLIMERQFQIQDYSSEGSPL